MVIKTYYEKYYNQTIDSDLIKETIAFKSLKFYDVSFKKKINYIYFYLSNSDITSLWNSLSIEPLYNKLVLQTINALIAYYKDKYPLIYNKKAEIITNLIMNEDVCKLLKKDINKITKIHCIYHAILASYKEVTDIYAFLNDITMINEKDYYRIDQNNCSIKLPFKQLFYPNNYTNFYLTFFNFFQDLEEHQKYESFSQAVTTYRLKQLAKIGKIKILNIEKDLKMNLNKYYEAFHKEHDKNVQMYNVVFEKLDSFHYEDINYLDAFFTNLKINNLSYYLKDNKIYFKTNVYHKIKALKGKSLNDFKLSLAIILEIMLNMQDDFNEMYVQNKKLEYIDVSLHKQKKIKLNK